MRNRPTIKQLAEMPLNYVAALTLSEIAMLLEDVEEKKAAIKDAISKINTVLNIRFADDALSARQAVGKNTGTITLHSEGFKIKADLPKKVDWNQALLRVAVKKLAEWGENPDEYVTTEIKVSETKYNAWPAGIRTVFEPARTLGVGNPTYKLEPK
jgi:predicted DNA-binding protein YlxM (UPF0122 family)